MNSTPPGVALVSGATGFLGRHLVRRLDREGWRVHVLLRPASDAAPLAGLASLTRHILDDDRPSLDSILASAAPAVVFHLATHFVAEHGADDIEPMVSANVLLGLRLLQALKDRPGCVLVNAGTSWQATDQTDRAPVNLYAATKQAFEDVIEHYAANEGLRAVTLRLFDVYGPGDPRAKLMSLLADAARSGAALDMSPGEQILDLLFVDDAVEGFMVAARRAREMPAAGHEVFALSGGDRRNLKEVVAAFAGVAEAPLKVNWGTRPYRDKEVMTPWTGPSLPGWSARVSLEEGMKRMLASDV